MNSQNLIPVFNGNLSNSETLLCDARKLHEFLQVGRDYSNWIKSRIEDYGFQENQDYLIARQIGRAKNQGRGGHNKVEYHITLDMAKELAMVERNEQGRAARRYFIECEKKLHEKQMSSEKKRLPTTVKRHIRNREDLSFTRRDAMGRLINWFPPADENGMYDWLDAYATGEAWFGEVIELAGNNAEEAYYALCYAPHQMTAYIGDIIGRGRSQGLGFVEGFIQKMARFTLAGILEHRGGVSFPFQYATSRTVDLETYLKQAAPLPDDELRWKAWNESAECRRRCYENRLAELAGYV